MVDTRLTLAVVVAVAVGLLAPASLGLVDVDDPTAEASTDPVAQPGCNYQQLYDETIDSVVSVTVERGGGSGFVTQLNDSTSVVVTNAHVVGDASSVTVEFREGDQREGTVVGADRLTDLAVVRVTDTPGYVETLPVAEGLPDPGRKVAALGHPFGLDETITAGIVSGTNRSLPTTEGYALPSVLQTDAAISPGNSGGPLVTCDGTVVGVNTAGIGTERAENIGFAVPATVVSEVVPELLDDGEADHAYLGVAVGPLTPAVAEGNDLDATSGVYVLAVGEGMPAAGALQGATNVTNVSGVRVPVGGDVIVAAEGQPIETPQDLKEFLLLDADPGDTVTITVLRDGQRTNVTVTLGERPDPESG